MKFDLKIEKAKISKAREKVIKDASKNTVFKGFRKGKAPLSMVEASLGEGNIVEKVLDALLPAAYADEIQKKKLKPIAMPKINPKTIDPDKDWVLEVEIAERPKIELGEYRKYTKAALKKVKPAKKDKKSTKEKAEDHKHEHDHEHDHDHEPSQEDQKIKAVFDSLLEKAKLTISPILVEEEVNNQLNRLYGQVTKLGLDMQQYLKSMKTDLEKLKAEYSKTAEENLKLEFILDEIKNDLKIKATDKQIDDFLSSLGSKEAVDQIKKNPREMSNIRHIVEKRTTIDKLTSSDL